MPIPVKFERFLNQDGTLKIDDYCEILNLRVPFTDLDVKSAYKPLALEYHPDKNRDCPYAITVFQAIADAKDKLLDPSTCQLYLRSLRELGVGRAGAGASADRASATYAPRSAAAAPPASAAPAQSARSTKPSRFTSAEPKSSPPPAQPSSVFSAVWGIFSTPTSKTPRGGPASDAAAEGNGPAHKSKS